MWGMQHKGSDIDQFICYTAPVKRLLDGTAENYLKSFVIKENGNDVAHHEASKVVEQLIKGNINFLWGVMSPIVVMTSGSHRMLKDIVKKNLAKNCYNSIHSLAIDNYKKYIESWKDPSEKKCNTIVRTINLGIAMLEEGLFKFSPTSGATPDDVLKKIKDLERAYSASKLPEKPNEAAFREWLLELRLAELEV